MFKKCLISGLKLLASVGLVLFIGTAALLPVILLVHYGPWCLLAYPVMIFIAGALIPIAPKIEKWARIIME